MAEGERDVTTERRGDGTVLLRRRRSLPEYPERVTDVLEQQAQRHPERTFVARRGADGAWRRVSYAETADRVRRLAGGLARLGLSPDRPIAILSGNGIEHLLLGLAAMHAGVPYCPVSPVYSQASSDLGKLRSVIGLLTPGLVAAFGPGAWTRAIEAAVPPETPILGDTLDLSGRRVIALGDLEAERTDAADEAHRRTRADTIAKFLLTSGSTGVPKAVITTQRMLCSNQIMLRDALHTLLDEPPVLVDWLPWNHVFGGSHNVHLVLFNGGTLFIDDGRPIGAQFQETVRNLREISPTIYLSVPKGFELLAGHLHADAVLRASFFERLRACFYAGAALSQDTWDSIESAAIAQIGARVPFLTSLGATETAPFVTITASDVQRAGVIGQAGIGNELKVTPVANKLELRVRGPHVTPGYWRAPQLTAQAFDEEGYFRLGDAVRFVRPDDPASDLVFDGRLSEDFKLSSGTWVSVGPLRAALLRALAPLAHEVIVAGLNRDYLAVLIVPDYPGCATALGLSGDGNPAQILADSRLGDLLRERLAAHARANPAGSTRVRRAALLGEPLSLDHGEITDKGSVNQRAVLERRRPLVEELYAPRPPPRVIVID